MSDKQEHYAYSPITDTWYRVDDYKIAGDNGQIIAKDKTEVNVSEVPEEQRKKVKARQNND